MRRSLVAALAAAVLAGGAVVALDARGGPGVPAALPSPSASPDPVRTPLLVPAGTTAPLPTAAGLRAALAGPLRDKGLGGRVGLAVVDAVTSATLLELGPTAPVTPASTAKIVTALTVLTALPADTRFRTRVVQGAPGDVVLVGGGDPTLAGPNALPGFPRPARLADLAARLHGLVVKRVVVDDSLFAGPRLGPGWKPGYVSEGDVAPVSALAVDEGRTSRLRGSARVADPALEAGRQLAALLHVRTVVRGRAVAGATELSSVASPTVGELVEAMLTRSDNDLAEALGRQAALALRLPPTFEGEAAAGRAV
ncbi:MAG: D-alanyl-D-alanine carboxypeptidase, partial [Mycobacteriales bacterium]